MDRCLILDPTGKLVKTEWGGNDGRGWQGQAETINRTLHREGLGAQVLSCRNARKLYKLGCGMGWGDGDGSGGVKARGRSGTTTEISLSEIVCGSQSVSPIQVTITDHAS